MVYYRFACKEKGSHRWRWHSTCLTSFQALFVYLNVYRSIPRDRVRIFFASSKEAMEAMLLRQNAGCVSCSLSVEQLFTGKSILWNMRRLEFEVSTSGDHDLPYLFTAPSTLHLLAWTKLKEKIHTGEVVP